MRNICIYLSIHHGHGHPHCVQVDLVEKELGWAHGVGDGKGGGEREAGRRSRSGRKGERDESIGGEKSNAARKKRSNTEVKGLCMGVGEGGQARGKHGKYVPEERGMVGGKGNGNNFAGEKGVDVNALSLDLEFESVEVCTCVLFGVVQMGVVLISHSFIA